jgi:hypothetical protein
MSKKPPTANKKFKEPKTPTNMNVIIKATPKNKPVTPMRLPQHH